VPSVRRGRNKYTVWEVAKNEGFIQESSSFPDP